jgi:hypothetical protein
MIRAGHVRAALLLTSIYAFEAHAQQPPTTTPVEFPKWDAGASWGLLFNNRRDLKAFQQDDGPENAVNVDFGRYFTTHLKADIGLLWSPSHFADLRVIPVPGLPPEFYFLEWAQVTIRPTSLSVAATYQFRENEFMHPYVSGGVRTIWESIHTVRDGSRRTMRGVTYDIPAVDEREMSVVVRPFVAVGCKSYFNRWVFMRSELLVALGPAGFSHTNLRIGTGFDF